MIHSLRVSSFSYHTIHIQPEKRNAMGMDSKTWDEDGTGSDLGKIYESMWEILGLMSILK